MSLSAFDTNVFLYAAGLGESPADRRKVGMAIDLVAHTMAEASLVVPAQVCLEFHHVLIRKGSVDSAEAERIIGEYTEGALIVPTDFDLAKTAFGLALRHGLQTYDAAILAAAARANCDILYSEDLQHGFEWQGVQIVNPFL